jgi:hypothetical protein
MPKFNPHDPIPLADFDEAVSTQAREHAFEVDQWLGFKIEAVESQVCQRESLSKVKNHETWSHISSQVFSTPYLELRLILELLNPQPAEHFVDLGSGYCRLAFVLERYFKGVTFLGIECVALRVNEALRIFKSNNLTHADAICADLVDLNFEIPLGDYYFIYDFGTRDEIATLLEKLKTMRIRNQKKFKLVGRGQRTLGCIESQHRSWLFKEGPLWQQSEFAIYVT